MEDLIVVLIPILFTSRICIAISKREPSPFARADVLCMVNSLENPPAVSAPIKSADNKDC